MLVRLLLLAAFLASLTVAPVGARQGSSTGGKDLIETRSAEPTGQSLYTNSHALIVGVNNYPNLPKALQLRFAVSDADSMRDMLVKSYGFDPSQVTVLTNEKATLANIRKELSQLASSKKVKADDRILVYFSGHGQTVKLPTGGDMGFLIPTDGKIDMNDPSDAGPYLETCMPMKQVWDYLASSPAKHACVIADACFSGMMATSRSVNMSTDTINAMLARPARQVLTAGSVGQKTFERQDLGHGVFTFKLLEELKTRAADKGKVFSVMDLYMALQNSVSNMTGGKQIPQFGSVETEGQMLFCAGSVLSANNTPSTTNGSTTGSKDPNVPVVAQDTRAKLTITSSPSGATLYIDGAKKGATPYTMQVDLKSISQKDYQLRVEAKGYIPAETTTTLRAGDDLSVPIELKRVPTAPPPVTTASVSIDSNPQGAAVFVDGKKVGVTPHSMTVDLKKKAQQSFQVRVELTGFVPAQSMMTVKRGSSVSVPFELKPITVKPIPNSGGQKPRNVKTLSMAKVSTIEGRVPVNTVQFSPDGKRVAVTGLDYSLTIFETGGGGPRKIVAPKNTIVRITPDWKKFLFVKLLTDGQRTWASIEVKDAQNQSAIGKPFRIDLRPDTALEDAYAGNGRLILCGSIGLGNSRTGFCTIANFDEGTATTLTGGFRVSQPASSADDSTYAVYMEPSDLRAAGTVVVIPADLTKSARRIETEDCNSSGGIELSDDGRLVAVTCQKITGSGVDILGTKIYDSQSGSQVQSLPKIRVVALIAKGTRVMGWRTQIGGPIVELLDMKTGNGLGEAPGTEIWLSRDEKLAAQATPEGTITIFRLNQP